MNWLDRKPTPSQHRSRLLKEMADSVRKGGFTTHSAQGATLQRLIEQLEETGDSYQLTAYPNYGYVLQGIPYIYKTEQEN